MLMAELCLPARKRNWKAGIAIGKVTSDLKMLAMHGFLVPPPPFVIACGTTHARPFPALLKRGTSRSRFLAIYYYPYGDNAIIFQMEKNSNQA
jgi:hypothetical protein